MRNRPFGLVAIAVLAIAALGIVGFYSYNVGVATGFADASRALAAQGAAPGTAAPGALAPYPYWYWHRPWGYGFGFFPFFPLLFILFWFVAARALFWRGGWWGHHRYRYYGGVPPAFDEWHRRAHAQQEPPKPASEPGA